MLTKKMSTLVSSVILLLNYISCSWMTWLAVKKPTKIAKNNRCESSLWRTSSCEPSLRGKKCRLTLGKSTRKGQDLEPLGLPSRAASPEWAFGKVLRSQMQLSSYWWWTSWPGSVRSASEIHFLCSLSSLCSLGSLPYECHRQDSTERHLRECVRAEKVENSSLFSPGLCLRLPRSSVYYHIVSLLWLWVWP